MMGEGWAFIPGQGLAEEQPHRHGIFKLQCRELLDSMATFWAAQANSPPDRTGQTKITDRSAFGGFPDDGTRGFDDE